MRVIAGEAKGRHLKSPVGSTTRPIIDRVKTALFDILANHIIDATVLDLFGGVGSVGIEALSRGAQHATFVELDPKIAAILRENLRITRLDDRAEVIRGDAFRFLEIAAATGSGPLAGSGPPAGRRFDLIYVAPPQYHQLAAKALQRIDAVPLTAPEGLVVVQVHPKERIDFMAVSLRSLRLIDERKYGSTLLLFYEDMREKEEA
jgi:16S rRNA (guanine(966)-N(2))-methyltransferase RsmD